MLLMRRLPRFPFSLCPPPPFCLLCTGGRASGAVAYALVFAMPLGVCKERCVGCRKCSTSTAQAIKGTAGVKVGKWIELVQSIIVTRSRQQTPLAECAVRIIQPSDKTRQVWSNEIYEIEEVYESFKCILFIIIN